MEKIIADLRAAGFTSGDVCHMCNGAGGGGMDCKPAPTEAER